LFRDPLSDPGRLDESNFDHSRWPPAFEYLDQEVGIVGVPSYWRYPQAFTGSRCWTISLVFDNTVLLRKIVRPHQG
jgi:hypothetical protein